MGGRHRAVAGDGRVQTRLLHGLEAQAVLHEHHLCVLQTRRDVEPLRPSLRAHEEKTRHDARDPPPTLISTLLALLRAFWGILGGVFQRSQRPSPCRTRGAPMDHTHISIEERLDVPPCQYCGGQARWLKRGCRRSWPLALALCPVLTPTDRRNGDGRLRGTAIKSSV